MFRVHQNVLCNASPVFKAALAGNFRESSEHSINLPEEDVGSVNRLIQWLYTRGYEVDAYDSRYWQLAKLNALADKHDIVTLRNDIVDKFFATLSLRKAADLPIPSIALVTYVYTNSSKRCALRDLIATVYCWKVSYSWYSKAGVKDKLISIPDFGVDIAIAMAQKLRGNKSPFEGKASVYHEVVGHEDPNEDQDSSFCSCVYDEQGT